MTNNCQSCTHSMIFNGKSKTFLVCQHENMDAIACHQVTWQCNKYEYEAGTDGENE